MRRFCVLTTGRTGSNALFDGFARHPDIAVPTLDGGTTNSELLHPRVLDRYRQLLAGHGERATPDAASLVDAFFDSRRDAAFAGFKLMPWQHPDIASFILRSDIKRIVLSRDDLPSMLASWFIANRFDSWQKSSRAVVAEWTFGRAHVAELRRHLIFVLHSKHQLDRVQGAIELRYEDLCEPGFCSEPLDEFFGRHVALPEPKAATQGREYLRNWQEFVDFVNDETAKLRPRIVAGDFDHIPALARADATRSPAPE